MKKVRLLVQAVIVSVCAFSVVYFWVLNARLANAPDRSDFQGAVEVLFKGLGLDGPSVRSLLTVSHSMEASRPNRLQVELAVCGSGSPIDGVLVFSGDARLSSSVELSATGELKPASLEPIHSVLTVGQNLTGGAPLEILRFHIDSLPSCVTPGQGQGPVPLGAGVVIGGDARSPVVEGRGAHYWIKPPAVGEIPGVSSSQLGVFNLDRKPESYYRAVDRNNGIRYELSDRFSRDFVRPDPVGGTSSVGSLEWQTTKEGATAHALVVDGDRQQGTQNLLILWSIIFGISGSLLATMIWELAFKNTSDPDVPKASDSFVATRDRVASENASSSSRDMSNRQTSLLDVLAVAILVAQRLRGARAEWKRKR